MTRLRIKLVMDNNISSKHRMRKYCPVVTTYTGNSKNLNWRGGEQEPNLREISEIISKVPES